MPSTGFTSWREEKGLLGEYCHDSSVAPVHTGSDWYGALRKVPQFETRGGRGKNHHDSEAAGITDIM